MSVFQAIFEPWSWERSLSIYWPIVVQGGLVSVSLGLLGCFLVVRGMSLIGDALSHSVLPGIVLGFVIGGSLHSPWILIGATLIGLAAAVLVQTFQNNPRVKEDAALTITFTTLFALGVVLVSSPAIVGGADLDPGCVLYGNIEFFASLDGKVPSPVWVMTCILVGIVAGIFIFFRQLLICTFDPTMARSLGINAQLVHYALMTVLSLTVVASFESVGAILAVALLITPGATARLWTDSMPRMLLIATICGVISTIFGYWLSHEAVLNTSAAGAMTLTGFVIFLLTWMFAPRHGLVMRSLLRRKLARAIGMENLLKSVYELGGEAGKVEANLARTELRMKEKAFSIAIRRAQAGGWLEATIDPLRLTERGRAVSQRLVRAHELWEQYLQTEIGLEADHVHDAAEWIEHHLDDVELEKLDSVLKPSPSAPAAVRKI